MKPTPRRDFPVSARTYASQSPAGVDELVGDAAWLMLNNTVVIAFVRGVELAALRLPMDDGTPRDEAEARGELVYGQRYVVTSSALRDGDAERIVGTGDLEGLDAVFFFVSPARFDELSAGVQTIAERTGGAIPSRVRVSDMGPLPVLDFVRNVVIESPLFDSYERNLLSPS